MSTKNVERKSPKNDDVEFPTFGEIARVSQSQMHWSNLAKIAKLSLISTHMVHVSDIKLIKTDTTL